MPSPFQFLYIYNSSKSNTKPSIFVLCFPLHVKVRLRMPLKLGPKPLRTLGRHCYHSRQSDFAGAIYQVAEMSEIRMATSMAIDSEASAAAVVKLGNPYQIVRQLASSNAVVLFSMSGCCMCTVAKRLLFSLGVGPTIIELDHHGAGPDIQAVLFQLAAEGQQHVPAVFVGGKFLGGIETLMACHINGTLVPLLKDAGALWL